MHSLTVIKQYYFSSDYLSPAGIKGSKIVNGQILNAQYPTLICSFFMYKECIKASLKNDKPLIKKVPY